MPAGSPLCISGEKAALPICKTCGANYFKIWELREALGFSAGWSAERGMFTGKPDTGADESTPPRTVSVRGAFSQKYINRSHFIMPL